MAHNVGYELERLEQLMASCVENWKQEHDEAGYENFLYSLEYLKRIVHVRNDWLEEQKEQLLSHLEDLYLVVQNKDIIAICDVMEWALLPLIRGWRKVVSLDDSMPDER